MLPVHETKWMSRHEDEDEIGVSDDELCWENDENEEWYQYFVENDW